jgi:hypothetical protein
VFTLINCFGSAIFLLARDLIINEFVKNVIYFLLSWIVFGGWAYSLFLLKKRYSPEVSEEIRESEDSPLLLHHKILGTFAFIIYALLCFLITYLLYKFLHSAL